MDTSLARAVSSRLADLLSREQVAMADFLVGLADFDRRRLWEPLGYTSLWHYLHRELGLSKGTAHYRQVAAGLVASFPEVEAALRDGRLCIASVVELARVVTPGNQSEVLPRFFHRSKQEAKAVAAALRPRQVVPLREVVTAVGVQPVELGGPHALPVPDRSASSTPTSTASANPHGLPAHPESLDRHGAGRVAGSPAPAPRPNVEPLTADLRRLHVTVSRRFLEKLDAARDALSHARPGADAEAILEVGLDLILAQQARRRAHVTRPRKRTAPPQQQPTAAADHVPAGPAPAAHAPADVRRAVWRRDEGRCQWRLESGGICGATHRLELDHIQPRALGGPSTVENLRVLCRPPEVSPRRGGDWRGRSIGWRQAGR